MAFETCTRRVASDDTIPALYKPCQVCGHIMIVHPGVHNTSLDECAICVLLGTAIRLEEQGARPHMIQLQVTEAEQTKLLDTLGGLKNE